jgi:hypothetical protein
MQSPNQSSDSGPAAGANLCAGSARALLATTMDGALLDLLEQWEEFHSRGEDPPPGWPGVTDPVLREALRERIET